MTIICHVVKVGVDTVSDEIPERSEIIRSSIITILLAAIFLVIAMAFWIWSAPGVTSPISALNDINPYITILLEIFIMLGFYVFATVTIINLRLYLTKVRAGWLELILMLIIVGAMSWLMFGSWVGGASIALSIGFIGYLYLLQD